MEIYLDLFCSLMIGLNLYFIIEKKFKGREVYIGYFGVAILLFILSR